LGEADIGITISLMRDRPVIAGQRPVALLR
jgi:hypothetical protein